MVQAVDCINAGAANMWRAPQRPFQIITPGVIGAGDGSTQLLRRVDEDHPAMPAHILKHVDMTVAGPYQQHRNAEECHRFDHARFGNILAKADCRPVIGKE